MPTEADTCRKFVVPKLQAAGWDNDPHSIAEQRSITDGRIIPVGKGFIRKPPKRVDYLLRYTRDFPLAVVEAKAAYKSAGDGLQQAKTYAEMLGLKFAYATNGREIIEYDYSTGLETLRSDFPTPDDLWQPLPSGEWISMTIRWPNGSLHRSITQSDKGERYYQQIAVNRTVEEVLKGERRLLLTMATGTGKTAVAFQICWKLWSGRWNRTGEYQAATHTVPRRPQHTRGSTQGRYLCHLRRRAIQNRVRRSSQKPGDVLCHLSGFGRR